MIQDLGPPVDDLQDSRPAKANFGQQARPIAQLACPSRSSACQTPIRGNVRPAGFPAQFPGSLEIKLTGDFDPPKLRQMTSLRQPPRYAAGQEASHWPANKIANPEDFSSCEQDSLTSLQQKKPPKRPIRLRLQVLCAILLNRFGKLGKAGPSASDLQRHSPRSLGSRRQR